MIVGHDETTIARIDSEIVGALRPAMATIPDAMVLCASSLSFVRSNVALRAWPRHHRPFALRQLTVLDDLPMMWKSPM